MSDTYTLYKTRNGVEIFVRKGSKSKNDFRVQYREPGKRVRTPKHIHWVVDLYIKREHARNLTNKLLDYFIDITKKIHPVKKFPPEFQYFTKIDFKKYEELDEYGEYSVDFLIATVELIMIQEKTNYPKGTINLNLLEAFRKNTSIFDIVSRATFR